MTNINVPLSLFDYLEIPLELKRTKTQIKVDNDVELLRALDYYQERKSKSQIAKEAIESKNIQKLTDLFKMDFRDEQLCKAMAKATIYPKGNTKENVPTKKDNEAFFRKRDKVIAELKRKNKV